jgi:hypothetical protein
MPSLGKRYPGVEGKTVEFIETSNEQQFVYVRIRFTDKTAATFVLTSDVVLYHAALYDESTGNLDVLRQYVKPDRVR